MLPFHKPLIRFFQTFSNSPVATYRTKKIQPFDPPFKQRFQIIEGKYLVPFPPLKPLTSYNSFTLEYTKIIRENYQKEPTNVILKKLSNLWNNDEFMAEHKLELINLSKFQYDLFFREQIFYQQHYSKPTRPANSFQIYMRDQYPKVQNELNTNDFKVVSSYISNKWAALSDEEKQTYKEIYKNSKVSFYDDLQKFEDKFKIPYENSSNVFNLFLKEHFQANDVSFANDDEHKKYFEDLRISFLNLSQEEKDLLEKKKAEKAENLKSKIIEFKKYFDLSDEDFQDICETVKNKHRADKQEKSQRNSEKVVFEEYSEIHQIEGDKNPGFVEDIKQHKGKKGDKRKGKEDESQKINDNKKKKSKKGSDTEQQNS